MAKKKFSRSYYGDPIEGAVFKTRVDNLYGQNHGSRKTALANLGLARRHMNMMFTGERAITPQTWLKLTRQEDIAAELDGRKDRTDPLS